MRIQCPENLRFPPEGSSAEGKSGPKARPKGVVDGKQVNIPVPPIVSDGVTEKDRSAKCRITWFKHVEVRNRQIRSFLTSRRELRET